MLKLLLGSALAAVLLSAASGQVPSTFWGVTGNVCASPGFNWGNCYEELPSGGWPIAFWFDRGGVSVIGQLGAEDRVDVRRFVQNTGAWWAVLFCAALVVRRRKKSLR